MGGASDAAFKEPASNVSMRQAAAVNAMDNLGGMKSPKPTGKYIDFNHVNMKPTQPENMYPYEKDLNMMVRRNQDDFPQYRKGETGEASFKRMIDTQGKSSLKLRQETIYEGKQSAIHLSSLMKSNGNGKYASQNTLPCALTRHSSPFVRFSQRNTSRK